MSAYLLNKALFDAQSLIENEVKIYLKLNTVIRGRWFDVMGDFTIPLYLVNISVGKIIENVLF
jgi:hypothetical protein